MPVRQHCHELRGVHATRLVLRCQRHIGEVRRAVDAPTLLQLAKLGHSTSTSSRRVNSVAWPRSLLIFPLPIEKLIPNQSVSSLNGTHLGRAKLHVTHSKDQPSAATGV